MGLVNQLQESAECDDVLTVLRKAKRVSVKLARPDISMWLAHEQNGYPAGIELPAYRQVQVCFCYNTNGYIPAGYGYLKNGIVPLPELDLSLPRPVREPISTVTGWLEAIAMGKGVYQTLEDEIVQLLRSAWGPNPPELLDQVTFMARLNDSQIRNIPECVKNKVLDWACSLESVGVTGDNQSFSDKERQAAQAVILNISNSSIDQLNASGANLKRS